MYKVHVVPNDVITVNTAHAVGVWHVWLRVKVWSSVDLWSWYEYTLTLDYSFWNTECPTHPARLYSVVKCQFKAIDLSLTMLSKLM